MTKPHAFILICAAALVACALVFTRPSRITATTLTQANSIEQESPIPEHVAYNFLFLSVASFRKKATERGKPEAINSALQREAALSDMQARLLDEIAAATLKEVDLQDARARVIIEAFRAHYPGGIVPQGEKLPPPPPELKAMQEERNSMVLRGRDRLLAVFGQQEFGRFNKFVMNRFAGENLVKKERR